MRFNPLPSGFLFSVDNFGATYTTAGFGTAIAQSVNAHEKGTAVEVIANTVVTADCHGIAIGIMANNSAAAVRNYLVDVQIDRSGGTTYTTVIPNLVFTGAGGLAHQWYYFPLYISADSSVALASQCNVGSGTAGSIPRMGVRLFGKPTAPHLCKSGSFVRAFGAVTATSAGTAITPGTSALGAYTASLGTTVDDLWWWDVGLSTNDASMTDASMMIDVACGDATNKLTCVHHKAFFSRSSETLGSMGSLCPPVQPIAAGAAVYARAADSGTPNTTNTVVAYGLGG